MFDQIAMTTLTTESAAITGLFAVPFLAMATIWFARKLVGTGKSFFSGR